MKIIVTNLTNIPRSISLPVAASTPGGAGRIVSRVIQPGNSVDFGSSIDPFDLNLGLGSHLKSLIAQNQISITVIPESSDITSPLTGGATPGIQTLPIETDGASATLGSASTFLRSDAQLIGATAIPGTPVSSDATPASQGLATTFLRSDAGLVVSTAVPSTNVQSDAGTASQGTSVNVLRADAGLLARTDIPVVIGVAAATGTSTALARADHVHYFKYSAISPAALTTNTNDWNPPGLSTCSMIYISSTGAVNLTGLSLVDSSPSQIYAIVNASTNTITLPHMTGSISANQWICPNSTSVSLVPNGCVQIFYNTNANAWGFLSVS